MAQYVSCVASKTLEKLKLPKFIKTLSNNYLFISNRNTLNKLSHKRLLVIGTTVAYLTISIWAVINKYSSRSNIKNKAC